MEFNNGNYRPDLLFDDPLIITRIKHHPMALWKTRKNGYICQINWRKCPIDISRVFLSPSTVFLLLKQLSVNESERKTIFLCCWQTEGRVDRYYQLTESDLRKFKPRFLQPTDLTNFRSFLFGWGNIAKFTLRS